MILRRDLKELDPEVKRLLDLAGSSVEAPDAAKRRVSQRLSQLVSTLPDPTSAPHAGRSPVSKAPLRSAARLGRGLPFPLYPVATAFVVGVATGAGAYALLRQAPPERIVYVDRPIAPAPSGTAAPGETSRTVAEPEPSGAPPPSPIGPTRGKGDHASAGSTPSHLSGLDAERALLDVSRRALASGRAEDALSPLSEHARRFPSGVLVEEREALAINALVATSRYAEARGRAEAFLRRYPNSLLRPSVEAAIAAIP